MSNFQNKIRTTDIFRIFTFLVFGFFVAANALAGNIDRLVFEPEAKNAKDKHIVIVTGDEEYRSEEWGPMLGKLLAKRHGFKTTVLFALDKESGIINPNDNTHIAGLESLADADLMILGTRWRVLPAEELQHFLNFFNAAKPIIALRTATHAFNNDDQFAGYDWQNFGRLVVGENWLNHHGEHKVEGGRGVIVEANAKHPVLNSVEDIFTWSDIYGIEYLDQDKATVLLRGAVTETLDEDSAQLAGAKNSPMMPLAWLKTYPSPNEKKTGNIFVTTAGAAVDFQKEDLRRLVLNASYYLLELEVPEKADATPVDTFTPSFYGFQEKDYFMRRGLRVEDFSLGRSGKSILNEDELQWLEKKRGSSGADKKTKLKLNKKDKIVLLGNGLAERMLNHGYFESELLLRNPKLDLEIRTLAKQGYTPAFRPHASRNSQWAFPGAEKIRPEFSHHSGEGHYPSPDQWLKEMQADTILAFFGFNEAFDGKEGLAVWRAELEAFIDHTLAQEYNGKSSPQLALVSPTAYQDLSAHKDLPDGEYYNRNFAAYTKVMREVAAAKGVHFVNVFDATSAWFIEGSEQLTVNGAQLNEAGYKKLAPVLNDALFNSKPLKESGNLSAIRELVLDKNFHWFQHYQMPNGVHVHGRRFEPYGVDNYPKELSKALQLTQNRDKALWAALRDKNFNLQKADKNTIVLNEIETNSPGSAENKYLYGQDALDQFTLADGYKMELFVSESEFPNMANPVQLSFDNRGRLWVAVMPSYPHYKPGDARPNDKLIIYEDTDKDGKADKETIFADKLHLPIGFEFTPEGVYLSQAPNLLLLKDLDGDDKADTREIILGGFDTHDTHHAISAFSADAQGSILMAEGVFLHSNIETAYGPVRAVNGGFYRFTPRTQKLERIVQTHIPNPWGIAVDQWGQDFFLSTSNPDMHWMLPVAVKTRYGQLTVGTESLVEEAHRVRPTSGLEFISSQHFPDEVQGDYLLNNDIGFLGAKQHSISDGSTGYTSQFKMNLYQSSDPNFRAVDMEFAPDGSLYIVDWHNQLIGHMQHNARDPLRDHAHGRIYRLSYPSRPLVKEQKIEGAPLQELFELLKSPDYRVRYRARREIREANERELLAAKVKWINALDNKSSDYERLLLEALWASNSSNSLDQTLVRKLLKASDFHVRAAAVRALRYELSAFPDAISLLKQAANDAHGRVRLEAIVAASWLDNNSAIEVLKVAGAQGLDEWSKNAFAQTMNNLGGKWNYGGAAELSEADKLPAQMREKWKRGAEIYNRDGYCATCHQVDGKGLPAAMFPPLAESEWVLENPEKLIDVTLYGLMGPIDVNGKHYPGHVPMTQFKDMLDDQEVADLLTYIRNAFGNEASEISPELVSKVRKSSAGREGFWTAEELDKKY